MSVSRFSRSRWRFGVILCGGAAAAAAVFFVPRPLATHAQPPAPTQNAGSSMQSTTFNLRWLKPSQLVQQLMPPESSGKESTRFSLPPGLLRVSPDDTTGRVFVQGSPESVTQMQTIARLLDVEPRRVQLSLRILRAPITALIDPAARLPQSDVVTTVAAACSNNQPLTLHAVGDGQFFRVQIMPHVNSDNSVTLRADLSEISVMVSTLSLPAGKKATAAETRNDSRVWARRIVNGATVIAVSVPDRKDPNMALYLEVTPLADTLPAAAPSQAP